MNCPACGAENREGAKFCRQCGAEMPPPEDTGEMQRQFAPTSHVAGETDTSPDLPTGAEPPTAQEAGPTAQVPEESAAEEEPARREREDAEPSRVDDLHAPPAPAPEGEPEPEAEGEAVEPETPPPLPWDEDEEPLPEPEDDILFFRDEAEPLQPAELGTVIADRYRLTEVLSSSDDEILYRAEDLQRCGQCGYEDNAPDDEFCARCGASLAESRAKVLLRQVQPGQTEPYGDKMIAAHLEQDGLAFLLLAEPAEEPPPPPPAPPGVRFLVGQRSDVGRVRELDEDSLLVLTISPTYEAKTSPVLGLFAVADGMGGHEGGEVASKLALQVLADYVLRTVILPELAGELILEEEVVVRLRQATIAANDAVFLTRQKRGNDMGTTLTAAFIRDDRLFLAHVGDCRAYRWNADGLEQLTTDHSVVASMIAEGRAAPEEIYTHPHRNIIYRCIGDKPVVTVDTDILPLAPGDRILLCSDGLWEMVRDEGIEEVLLQEADVQAACDLLIRNANLAGGEDNISVIIVQVDEV